MAILFLNLANEFFFQGKARGTNEKIYEVSFHHELDAGSPTTLKLRVQMDKGVLECHHSTTSCVQ